MEQAIRNFHRQFGWTPSVKHMDALPSCKKFILDGMGGSHLAAHLLSEVHPEIDISVFSDYGIPRMPPSRLENALFIASSYSGNTEEPIDFAKLAVEKGYPVATISIGGQLAEFAQAQSLPHVIIPDTHIQPRSALGFSLVGLAALMRDRALLEELRALEQTLSPDAREEDGQRLSDELRSKIPVIYASSKNSAIAYNWKIKFNETGKIPAFYNLFPELNHNEMTGFDAIESTEGLSRRFHFIFIRDEHDHPKVQKRMEVCKKLYEDRGFGVTMLSMFGKTPFERIFNSLLTADWTALYLSRLYGTEAEQVPMVEEFKKLVSST